MTQETIYTYHQEKLVPLPVMEEPKLSDFTTKVLGWADEKINIKEYERAMKFYNNWKKQEISITKEHLEHFKNGKKELREGVDFRKEGKLNSVKPDSFESEVEWFAIPIVQERIAEGDTKNVHYKWSKIFAGKRYGGKDPIELNAIEQQELLDDIRSLYIQPGS